MRTGEGYQEGRKRAAGTKGGRVCGSGRSLRRNTRRGGQEEKFKGKWTRNLKGRRELKNAVTEVVFKGI